MPDLTHSLLKQDIGHLRIIAEFWGLELDSADVDSARDELSASLLEPNLLAELMDSLSPQADSAITDLVTSGGRIAWSTFTRKYGDIREMGAGKRDRERPHLKPSSTAEILFYRGMLARAFFETDKGSQEFVYIPDDLLLLIESRKAGSDEQPVTTEALGRPASPKEKGQEIPANDFILDDATTLLAALRMGKTLESLTLESDSLLSKTQKHTLSGTRASGLQSLLTAANLLKKNTIQAEAVKAFLEAPRADALKMLQDAWLESTTFNELKLMPGIVCEGEWTNQPQETREFLLNLLDAIPEGKWWSLNSFIRDVKQKYADFQRPAGDYDSWFIKRESDGQFMRGFSYWDQVDGALIKYFITNILHWLGQVDLSIAEGATEPTTFRISSLDNKKEEKEKLSIASTGKISIPRDAPRVVRYQVSRFCEWEEPKGDDFRYRISTHSLAKAKEQGLKIEHLLPLLAKHSAGNVPPTLVKALKRWEVSGTEARAETQVVLRLSRPEILEELRKSKAAKFLGEVLSPTAVVVKSGAIQKVLEALMELGIMGEGES
ncbi:MAG: helicase-associated domain-containing protein [Chloroflexota bacterium]